MKTALAFIKGLEDWGVHRGLYGKYDECGILFVGEREIELFMYCDSKYTKQTFSLKNGWSHVGKEVDFLLLSVDEEETRRLRGTCEACVRVQMPYNMSDLVLMLVPLREPKEVPFEEAKCLNHAQAVVVMLRGCLERGNPLVAKGLEGVNSRKVLLSVLYERLLPFTLIVKFQSLLQLLRD